jgi:D-alanyl-D-alanine carboxypeptidase
MTAEVVLEDNPDLTREVVVERADVTRANHTYLRAGEHVTIDDLLHLTLIASDNAAARALARTSPMALMGSSVA